VLRTTGGRYQQGLRDGLNVESGEAVMIFLVTVFWNPGQPKTYLVEASTDQEARRDVFDQIGHSHNSGFEVTVIPNMEATCA
jgi:hypothetical protein